MAQIKEFELGVFLPVANNGWIMSKTSPQYMPTWDLNRRVTLLAEEMGFQYVFSMGKWRGLGGETKFWNYSVEPIVLSTGLLAVSSKLRVVASVSPLLIHPAVVAKMLCTLDDIAGGRVSINIITAGNHLEYAQMGLYPDDFESYRYDYVEEWLEVVRRLWTEERVDFSGRFFTLTDCMSDPKPIQQPHPRVVCAVASERGFQFVAERCDEAFFGGANLAEKSRRAREMAHGIGRTIKTQTHVNIIQGKTDADAYRAMDEYRAGVDLGATVHVPWGDPNQRLFYGGEPIVGGPERIADGLAELVLEKDMDGVLLTFPDFINGLEKLRDDVLPLLPSRGITLAPQNAMVPLAEGRPH